MGISLAFTTVLLSIFPCISTQTTSLGQCQNSYNNEECVFQYLGENFEDLSSKISMQTKVILDAILSNRDTASNSILEKETCPSTIRNESLPENCKDLFGLGYTQSGTYIVYEPLSNINESPFRSYMRRTIRVFCDMDETHGGPGWMVFQRRQDGSVTFTHDWNGYKNGFGDLDGELWIGNENLAILTGGDIVYELRVDMEDFNNERRYARYASFKVESEESNFKLRLGTFLSGDAGDSFGYHNGQEFSTYDRENDKHSRINCALQQGSGNWFKDCATANINSPYPTQPGDIVKLSWEAWGGEPHHLKYFEVKLRPVS